MTPLAPGERAILLRLARRALERWADGDDPFDVALPSPLPPALDARRGVFVTLKKEVDPPVGVRLELRGCLGDLSPAEPLHRTVMRCAVKSASQDPRFPPVTASELAAIRVELSVLTAETPVGDPASIVIGRDGLRLRRGPAQGVFLPQVAAEQRWTRERYLEQLAMKAGLQPGDWRDAELYAFRAEVFGE